MKNVLLIIFMASVLFSCKKDDPTNEGTPILKLTGERGEKTWQGRLGRQTLGCAALAHCGQGRQCGLPGRVHPAQGSRASGRF